MSMEHQRVSYSGGNSMKCKYCNKEIPTGAKVCPKCKALVPVKETKKEKEN